MNSMEVEPSPWESHGEPTTTAYGANNSGFNELGQRLHPKPVHNLHGIRVGGRQAISNSELNHLAVEFHKATGKKPTKVFLAQPSNGDRGVGFTSPQIGWLYIDLEFNAEKTRVE